MYVLQEKNKGETVDLGKFIREKKNFRVNNFRVTHFQEIVIREKMHSGKCHSGKCVRENDRESFEISQKEKSYKIRGEWYKMIQNRYKIRIGVLTPFGGKRGSV